MALNVADTVRDVANQYGVDPDLALNVARTESNLNPAAMSPKGALGPMQLMPATAKDLGVDPHDVQQNIVGGVKYLKQLSDRYGGDHTLIAAAYNAGPGAVDKHGGVPPFPETQAYVKKVTGSNDDEMPSPEAVLKSIGYTGAESAPAPAAPADAEEPPSPDEILKQAGWKPSTPPAKPVSTAQASANADMAKQAKPANIGDVYLNSLEAGARPIIDAGISALGTGAQNLGATLGIGKAAPYGMKERFQAVRDSEQAALDAYAKEHPLANIGSTVAGFISPFGAENLVAHGVQTAATKAVPALASSVASRVATRVGAGAVGAGAYGTGSALSSGEDVPGALKEGAETAVLSVPFGVAGEGLGAAVKQLKGPVLQRVAPVLGGTAVGATLGGLSGGEKGAEAGALNGSMVGAALGMGRRPKDLNVAPTQGDQAAALDLLAKRIGGESRTIPSPSNPGETALEITPVLQSAHPASTTAEALGEPGIGLLRSTAAKGGTTAEAIQSAVEARNAVTHERVASDLQEATGIAPDTAKQDAAALVDQARQGPGRAAYEAAITGKPVWTPELSQLAREPEVRSAMNNARRLLGERAMADNPTANITDEKRPVITPEDYQRYLKTGDESLLGGDPQQAPTDEMWDLTKKLLDKSVKRDAFGRPEKSSENHLSQEWSKRLTGALDEALPGYKEARAIGGDYLSADRAYDNAPKFGAKSPETAAEFDARFQAMTPFEQSTTRHAWLADAYSKVENGKLNPDQVLGSPFQKGAIETMFGKDAAGRIIDSLKREKAFATTGKKLSSVRAAPEAEGEGVQTGMLMGALEHGFNPLAIMKGAAVGMGIKSAKGVLQGLQEGNATPGVRNALGEILAQSPQETARQLNERIKARKSPIEQTLRERRPVLTGVQAAGGVGAQHALSGLTGERQGP